MSNSVGRSGLSSHPSELRRILSTYFNDNELRNLCVDLNIDYEELAGSSKSAKARELVSFVQRHHGSTGELVRRITELRPHAGINLQRVAGEILPPGDPRLGEITGLLNQIRTYNERLNEWKGLHNRLDTILNISFGQYESQVVRYSGQQVEPALLSESWRPVSLCINKLLIWAKDIQHIGEPFREREKTTRGEPWAVELSELSQAIEEQLREMPRIQQATYQAAERQPSLLRLLDRRPKQSVPWNDWWWQQLIDLNNQLHNKLQVFMSEADENLRNTAVDLYDLSKEALWG